MGTEIAASSSYAGCVAQNCRKIHHELPDCVVRYKRYESEYIEEVVSQPEAHDRGRPWLAGAN
ncbi:DUF6431 domain-containing protein [Paenibacillus sp. DMB20]|uniref:DUF6431 domain-containing protein n=1 Tax=Paenibacillus sp. DMB20 TaxID=1642570 RepID=UPI003FA583A6